MSKKANKTQMRKLQTRTAMEKRRAKKVGHGYMSLALEDDYYATADHLSYHDLNDLLGVSRLYGNTDN